MTPGVIGAVTSLTAEFKTLSKKLVALENEQQELNKRCDSLDKATLSGEVRELRQQLRDADQQSRAANLEIVELPVTHPEVRELRQQLRDSDQQSRAANLEIVGLPVTHPEVRELRQQLRDSDQQSRAANLEIVGLPVTYGENIYDRLQKVAAIVQVPFKREDISKAHRLRLFSKKHAHRSVCFTKHQGVVACGCPDQEESRPQGYLSISSAEPSLHQRSSDELK
ncbi:hypothetical protein J6590_069167 [Homalodisca vitripennis]|nr:hypothetical protein J6590_069167 [Homalodisca vitripennis]